VEPVIDKTVLVEVVRREYGLRVESLDFLPAGWVAYCYVANCAEGERYYRRNLEDLADWVVRILRYNSNDEQDREDLQGIVEDCMSGWPYLETTISKIEAKLAQRE
jgi:hypothetical protein